MEESSTDNSAGATYDNYYDTDGTDGLKGITASYDNYKGNDESRDAFFANKLGVTIESSVVLSDIYLTRPFGQLNVLTALTDVPTDMYPKYVQISSSTPLADTFDVYSGETSISDETSTLNNFKWSLAEAAIDGEVDDAGLMHLSTDYIFAPNYDDVVKQQLVDFEMSFYKDDTASSIINTNTNFKSIPIQRNYRTNVSGELLTKQGTINVTIDPTFIESDITKEFTEVASVAELATLMASVDEIAKADASYVVAGVVEAEADSDDNSSNTATITIPDLTATGDTSRSIELKEGVADGVTLTITTATPTSDESDPDVVYITIPTTDSAGNDITTENLVINLPNSTVYINGVLYDPEVSTSGDTFIIQEGATVDGLTINKGNVDVYGTLKGYVKLGEGNESATVTVYTATADVSGVTKSESTTDYGWAAGITVVYVDPSQPIQNVTSGISYSATQFQAAIDAAADGDVIELAAGVYNETNIKINKTLTIKGAQAGVSALSSSRDIDVTTNETVFTGNFSSVGATDKTVVVDGVYFLGGSQYTATEVYNFTVVSTDKVEVTNCMAKDINRYLIYNNTTSSLINELVVTNNKFFGDYDESTKYDADDLLIYVNMVKSLTVTGNYLSSSSRGVNIAVTEVTATHDGYDSEITQATITNNTFTDMKNYGVQTSYYPYGKIVINLTTRQKIKHPTPIA
ncbi:MAG: DUF6562 domain-containing protein [Rikenellaceae bacterium]